MHPFAGSRLRAGVVRAGAIALLAGLAIVAPSAAGAQAQVYAATSDGTTTDAPIPIVLTVSGGVSIGSYHAGLNWTLTEFFKRATFDDAYRRMMTASNAKTTLADFRSPGGGVVPFGALRKFDLSSVAGASAGNINAVLSALSWCEGPTNRPPEESLFWSTWVTTGWEQLFLPDRSLTRDLAPLDTGDGDAAAPSGVFSRRYFRQALYPEIGSRMRDPTHRARTGTACDVPVGITITRMTPESVPVLDSLTALTQRFVSIVRVHREQDSTAIRFMQPDHRLWYRAQELGSVIALAGDTVPGNPILPDSTVFGLVEASSAFPLAFAPKKLRYYRVGSFKVDATDAIYCVPLPITRTASADVRAVAEPSIRCARPDEARFVDGGVFDNNPLDLALEMSARRRCVGIAASEGRKCGGAAPPYVLFLDPDNTRGRLAQMRAKAAAIEPDGGLDAVFALLRGAVPSARQYELQVFGRMLERQPTRGSGAGSPTPRLLSSYRTRPLYGDYLGAFGAFLGRPLREHDFYVGIYDGARMVARQFLCPQDAAVLDACEARRLREFIAGAHVDVGVTGQYALRAIHEADTRDASAMPALASDSSLVADTTAAGRRAYVVTRLVAASDFALSPRPRTRCAAKPPVRDLFCHGSFDMVLDSAARDTTLRRIVDEWKEQCREMSVSDTLPDPCLADVTFARLLGDRDAAGTRLIASVLHQNFNVEDSFANPRTDKEAAAQALEFINQSADELTRHGRVLDASTIPMWDRRGWVQTFRIVPYYVAASSVIDGIQFGWRPGYFVDHGRIGFMLPIDAMRLRTPIEGLGARPWQSAVGPGVAVKVGRYGFTRAQLAAQWLDEPLGMRERFSIHRFSPEFALSLAAGKLRLGARRLPERMWREDPRGRRPTKSYILTVGVADLNGMLYYLLAR